MQPFICRHVCHVHNGRVSGWYLVRVLATGVVNKSARNL